LNQNSSRTLTSRTVSRAVARSRAVRAGVARRRRRTAAIVACLAAVAGLPLAWSMAEPAEAMAQSAVAKAQDLADLLSSRSPGTRSEDQLTKHARAAAKLRTHPKIAPAGRPTAPDAPSATSLVDLLQAPVVPLEIASADSPNPFTPPPSLSTVLESTPGSGGPGAGGGGGGGGGGDGPQTFPSSEPRQVIPSTSAVPEPGTWAMMLMGFGLIAWRARRRKPVEAAKPA
jgi:hypothetical protein